MADYKKSLLEKLKKSEAQGAHHVLTLADVRECIQALLLAQKVQWKPISTAPKDGTPILVWWPEIYHYPFVAFWADKWESSGIGWKWMGWGEVLPGNPRTWMPLDPLNNYEETKLQSRTDKAMINEGE